MEETNAASNDATVTLVKQVAAQLLGQKQLLAVAESCTGGMLAAALTDQPGSSAWFERGFVTYSDNAKYELLQVSPSTLSMAGAVSEAVARQMALGALRQSDAHWSIAITGVAGPDGGSAEKPIGTVCFAWATTNNVHCETLNFSGDRQAVRLAAVRHALERLHKLVQRDNDTATTSSAILAGGCFWCLEAVFKALRGVRSVQPGYIGGHTPEAPDYRRVCQGKTGHAEAVEIIFEPHLIDFATLLDVFFALHDPTTRNRQGNDVGTQYRSAIFCRDQIQYETAQSTMANLVSRHVFSAPIVTEVVGPENASGLPFYVAESEHHDYYARNGYQPYCMATIDPKMEKLASRFKQLLR